MNNPGVVNPGCKSIKHIRAKFKQRSKRAHSNAHVKLNVLCSHSLLEINNLFGTKDRLKVDRQCIGSIWNKTITTPTECAHEARQTISDTSSQITNLPMSLKSGNKHAPL